MNPPHIYPMPTLDEIRDRTNEWWQLADGLRPIHTKKWEISTNPGQSLYINKKVVNYLLNNQKGPKKRYGKRTKPGRPPSQLTHLARRESLRSCLAFEDFERWNEWLEYLEKIPIEGKRHKFTVHMPDLSLAVPDLIRSIKQGVDKKYHHHSIFSGTWQKQLCRLVEIRVKLCYMDKFSTNMIEEIAERADGNKEFAYEDYTGQFISQDTQAEKFSKKNDL